MLVHFHVMTLVRVIDKIFLTSASCDCRNRSSLINREYLCNAFFNTRDFEQQRHCVTLHIDGLVNNIMKKFIQNVPKGYLLTN